MFVTFFDTCMVSLAAIFVWRISPYWVFLPWLTIACLDGVYLSSSLTKVPDGAWFTLTLASVLAGLFILWRFGKEQQWASEAADRFPTTHFVKKQDDGRVQLTSKYGGGGLSTIKGFGIFFDKAGETTPIVFSNFIVKLVAAPEVMVLFHLRPLETPSVAPEDRYSVSRLAIPNCYRLIVRHGYMDDIITPDLASLIYEQIRSSIILRNDARGPIDATTPGPAPVVEEHIGTHSTVVVALTSATATDVDSAQFSSAANTDSDTANTLQSRDTKTTTTTSSGSPKGVRDGNRDDNNDQLDAELAKIEDAYAHQVLYIIGKEQMKVRPGTGVVRKVLLCAFLWIRENTRTKIANLKVPMDRVFEVGFVKDI